MRSETTTIEGLRDYLVQAIPATWVIWEDAKKASPVNDKKAAWAVGRLDGLMQILRLIDNDEFDRLREERQKRVNAILSIEDADDQG